MQPLQEAVSIYIQSLNCRRFLEEKVLIIHAAKEKNHRSFASGQEEPYTLYESLSVGLSRSDTCDLDESGQWSAKWLTYSDFAVKSDSSVT